MDLAMIQANITAAFNTISSTRMAEMNLRDAVSGVGIERIAKDLFPGVADDFIKSNQHFPNPLQRAVNRYGNVVTRAALNWEWTLTGDPPQGRSPGALLDGPGRELLQAAAVDAVVTGKFAFFPYRDERGIVRISVLNGFLWPIYQEGNSTVLEALLQINYGMVNGKMRYEVRRYTPGLLEVYSNLDDWKKYATAPKTSYPQPHALNRLPVSFRITGRDANRLPEGLAATAMPAFLDYVKARMLMAFVSELGSFEERTFYSDEIFKLAKENPNHPLLKSLKTIAPRSGKFMPSGDKYERQPPVDLKAFRERAQEAGDAVDMAMNLPPNAAGANLTGVAIQEMREGYTETCAALTNLLADGLTDAVALAAAMNPSPVAAGYQITLMPKFTQDVDAEREAIRKDFQIDLIDKPAALSGLQSLGVTYVTDQLIEKAKQEEEALKASLPEGS